MAGPFANLIRQIRAMAGGQAESELPDGELLARYARDRSEQAFAEIVRRHGPMVLSVCRRIVLDPDLTEDSFQIVFCVLAKRAGLLQVKSLGGWLHGVAMKAALRLRAQGYTRSAKERQAMVRTIDSDADTAELRGVLDEELQALPSKYREPLILCYLEGMSQDQAAQLLGWPRTSMGRWMKKACDALRVRLERRGVALATGLAVLSQATANANVSASLACLVISNAMADAGKSGMSASLLTIAEDVARETAHGRIRLVALVLTAISAAMIVGSLGTWSLIRPEGKTVKPVLFRHDAPVAGMALSQDGKTLAVTTLGQGPYVWNTETGKRVATGLKFDMSAVGFDLAMSPDGSLVATSIAGEPVRMWNSADGKELPALPSPERNGGFVAFSGNGELIAAPGDPENSVHLWRVRDRRISRALVGHGSGVSAAVFLADQKSIVTASLDKTIRLWELSTGKERKRWLAEDAVYGLAVVNGDRWIVSMSPACLEVIDLGSGKRIHKIEDQGRTMRCLAGRDRRIIVGSEKGGKHSLWILDLDEGQYKATEKIMASKITAVALPDAHEAFVGCSDGSVSRIAVD